MFYSFHPDQKSGFNIIWKLGALRIFYYLTRLVILIKLRSEHYKFKLFTPKLFKLLGDPSAEFSFYFTNNLLRSKPSSFQKIHKVLFAVVSKFFNPHHLFEM